MCTINRFKIKRVFFCVCVFVCMRDKAKKG